MTSTLVPNGFDDALRGLPCSLAHDDGSHTLLPVNRWRAPPGAADEALLLRGCTGPTVDIGCGPGRLVAALSVRGVVALGIDVSPLAVALTRSRGAMALHRDVHDRLPGEGRWRHVLLADGNIGIGGNPARLLRRAGELLLRGGTVLAEVEPPGSGVRCGSARLVHHDTMHHDTAGPSFPWCRVSADAATAVADAADLRLLSVAHHGGRWAALLQRR